MGAADIGGTSMTTFTVDTIQPQAAAAVRAEVPMAELPHVFDRGFPAVMQAVAAQGIAIAGPPFGFYPRLPADTVAVVVGFPVATPVAADGEVEPFELPGGRVVTGTHVGPYDALEQTYRELMGWTQAQGLTLGDAMWECYLNDPRTEPDASTLQTLVVWPLA
jgi:AraC family transcriptional regulator